MEKPTTVQGWIETLPEPHKAYVLKKAVKKSLTMDCDFFENAIKLAVPTFEGIPDGMKNGNVEGKDFWWQLSTYGTSRNPLPSLPNPAK